MGTFYDTILKPASEAIGYRRADPPPKPKTAPWFRRFAVSGSTT
jgi:hypothetical protein